MTQDFIFLYIYVYVSQSGHIYYWYSHRYHLPIFTNVKRHNKKTGVIKATDMTITLACEIWNWKF